MIHFQVLGVHFSGKNDEIATIRTFQPHAYQVDLLTGEQRYPMIRIRAEGVFEISIDRSVLADPALGPFTYQFEIHYHSGAVQAINDPYRFLPQLDERDRYLFNFGTNYRLYDHMGSHLSRVGLCLRNHFPGLGP